MQGITHDAQKAAPNLAVSAFVARCTHFRVFQLRKRQFSILLTLLLLVAVHGSEPEHQHRLCAPVQLQQVWHGCTRTRRQAGHSLHHLEPLPSCFAQGLQTLDSSHQTTFIPAE